MSTTSSSSFDTSLALATSTATDFQSTDFFTSGSPSPTSSTSSNGSSNNNPTSLAASSSLYLFTFLATLLLLLAVSSAIIIRSFIIRRRFHRRVQEALAEGIVLPPQPGQRRRDFGEKPRLWDAHLVPDDADSRWQSMMPVSVRVLSDKLTGTGQRLPNPPARTNFLQTASFGLVGGGHRNWRPRFLRSRAAPSSSSPPSSSAADANTNTNPNGTNPDSVQSSVSPLEIEDARLQISVLIAMPSPYRPRAWTASPASGSSSSIDEQALTSKGTSRTLDGEEDELPDVAFGVTEVPWKIAIPAEPTTGPGPNSNPPAPGSGAADQPPPPTSTS